MTYSTCEVVMSVGLADMAESVGVGGSWGGGASDYLVAAGEGTRNEVCKDESACLEVRMHVNSSSRLIGRSAGR